MNIRIGMITAAFLLMALTGPSSAAFFDEFKMVGSSGSTTLQSSFDLSETPYLYYKVSPVVNGRVLTAWLNGINTYGLSTPTQTLTEGWLSLASWDTVKKTGTWDVKGYLQTGGNLADCKTASFVVTPEPMALILYGLGGLPIAAHLLRRRKVAA